MLQAIHSMLTGGYIIVAIAIFSYSCNEDVQFVNFNITVSKRLYWPPDIASVQLTKKKVCSFETSIHLASELCMIIVDHVVWSKPQITTAKRKTIPLAIKGNTLLVDTRHQSCSCL